MAQFLIFSHAGGQPTGGKPAGFESFNAEAAAGRHLEFELHLSRDEELLVAADSSMARVTKGRVKRDWNSLDSSEIFALENQYGPFCRLSQILDLAKRTPALHLAAKVPATANMDIAVKRLAEVLAPHPDLHPRVLVRGLRPEAALLLRRSLPAISLAAMVSHAYDISRFQTRANGLLLPLEALTAQTGVFNWAWLIEWDRLGRKNSSKSFYNRDVVEALRKAAILAVMESPDLRPLEHPDMATPKALEKRWREMVACAPEGICTAYPARLMELGLGG